MSFKCVSTGRRLSWPWTTGTGQWRAGLPMAEGSCVLLDVTEWWGWSGLLRRADLPCAFVTRSSPSLSGRWGFFGKMIFSCTRHMASKLDQGVHNKFLFVVLFKASQWEWPHLFTPLSVCQWLGNSKWWSIILSKWSACPKHFIHTFSLIPKEEGTNRETTHYCYVATTLSGHRSHESKPLDSCHGVRFISANSLQEMCFLIRPSSTETVKIQKTTLKARGTDYQDKRGEGC